MNVLQIQDDLKNFSEDQLIKEMQQPSGSAPQFLVLSELNRRKRVKGDFEARQAQQQPTVAQEVVAAAGLPQAGMMGMSEAMAPQSAVSDGVGTNAPMKMASGGLAQFGNEIRQSMGQEIDPYLDGVQQEAEQKFNIDLDQDQPKNIMQLPGPRIPSFGMRPSIRPAIEQVGIGGKGFARPEPAVLPTGRDRYFTNAEINVPFGNQLRGYAEGGVIKAQQGVYFDAMGRPTQELINAMIMQESGGDVKARGSLDEVGLSQIRPSTAIMPGYGVKSMFPELEGQVGKGKKYATAQEAYLDNKDMVDSRLEEGDTSKDFMADLLTGYRKNTDTDAGAISAYNVGLGGLKNIKNPADFSYFKDVVGKMNPVEYSEVPLESGMMSAVAGTLDDEDEKELNAAQIRNKKRGQRTKEEDAVDLKTRKRNENEGISSPSEQIKKLFPQSDETRKEKRDRIRRSNELTRQGFYIPEDSLSGIETFNMGSPADASEQEKAQTEAALISSAKKEAPDASETKTPLTTLEQELLNRQKQLQKDRDFDRYMALAQAGLSIMSSDKPTLAGAIGEGGTAGLTAFRDAQKRYQEGLNDILNARVKLAGKKGGLTQKEAISAISAIDSNIATLRGKIASATDPAIIKEIEDEIAQFNFQKESLMPRAGFSRLSMNVSDSAAK